MPISRNGKVYLHRYYYNKGLFQIKAILPIISGLTKLVVRRGTAYFLLGTSISFICKLKSNKIGIVTDSRESNFQQFFEQELVEHNFVSIDLKRYIILSPSNLTFVNFH